MKTPEQQFWHFLRDYIPGDKVRIENTIGNGMPDVNACHKGREIWLELKVARFTDEVKIRIAQHAWGFKRAREGGNVFVVALCNGTHIAVWKHPFQCGPASNGEKDIIELPKLYIQKHYPTEMAKLYCL